MPPSALYPDRYADMEWRYWTTEAIGNSNITPKTRRTSSGHDELPHGYRDPARQRRDPTRR